MSTNSTIGAKLLLNNNFALHLESTTRILKRNLRQRHKTQRLRRNLMLHNLLLMKPETPLQLPRRRLPIPLSSSLIDLPKILLHMLLPSLIKPARKLRIPLRLALLPLMQRTHKHLLINTKNPGNRTLKRAQTRQLHSLLKLLIRQITHRPRRQILRHAKRTKTLQCLLPRLPQISPLRHATTPTNPPSTH